MKNFIIAMAFAVTSTFAFAGDAPKAQAPAKPEAKKAATTTTSTVLVARPATLRERRHLVVVEPVKVVETKKVVEVKEVKVVKGSSCDCCEAVTATPVRGLLGRVRGRVSSTVSGVADCVSCK